MQMVSLTSRPALITHNIFTRHDKKKTLFEKQLYGVLNVEHVDYIGTCFICTIIYVHVFGVNIIYLLDVNRINRKQNSTNVFSTPTDKHTHTHV